MKKNMVCSRCPSSCSFSTSSVFTAVAAPAVFFFFLLSPLHVSAQTNGSTTYTTDPVEGFEPSVFNERPHKAITAGVLPGIAAVCFIILGFLAIIFVLRRKRKDHDASDDEELKGLSVLPNIFSYSELKNATKNFSPENKLGKGGFGDVFKGKLIDGRVVAVKKLTLSSLHGKRQFVTEVSTISYLRHRNLVKLYGCCYEENKRLLVLEYLENKSLDQALFGKSGLHLDWPTRFMISIGTARGLPYLHEESSIRVIHRDIKAGNILLDADLTPKITNLMS